MNAGAYGGEMAQVVGDLPAKIVQIDHGFGNPGGFGKLQSMVDQRLSVQLCAPLGGQYADYARVHLEVIERCGRFPHRNIVFGRDTTPEEQAFLDGGGFSG